MELLKKIFVVDDDCDLRMILARYLKGRGHVVETFANVSEAIEKVHELKPECIITDFDMPDGTGIDLIKFAWKFYKKIPALVMTGSDLDEVRDQIGTPQDIPILTKPFSFVRALEFVEAG